MDRVLRPLVMGALVVFAIGVLASWSPSSAQDAEPSFDPAVRPEFREPVVLASKDGVLEVTLTAHQGVAHLDTVAVPVKNFLVFAY